MDSWSPATVALAAIGFPHALVWWWLRQHGLPLGVKRLVAPAAALVWVHGIAFAAALAIRDFAPASIVRSALTVLDWLYALSVIATLFWLLSRIGAIAERLLLSLSARAETSWDDVLLPLAGRTIKRALPLDYSISVEALRRELTRILEQSRYWDRRVNVLQVTDAKEHTLELRAPAGADASIGWDLRCEMRERLIAFIQRHYPESLPRVRASFAADPIAAAPAPLAETRVG